MAPGEIEIIQETYKAVPKTQQSTAPTSYEFVTFSEVGGMRDASAKSQIRKHAMKDIGVIRRRPPRRPRPGSGLLEVPLRPLASVQDSPRLQPTSGGTGSGEIDVTPLESPAKVGDNGPRPVAAVTVVNPLASSDILVPGSSQRAVSFEQGLTEMLPSNIHHLPIVDDRALYDPCVRTMSCRLDPFGTASVIIDRTVRGLLEYFIYYSESFPNTWTYCPSSLHHTDGPKIEIRGVVEPAFEDDLVMNCLLSAAASRLHYVDGVDGWQATDVSATQQALELLRERIEDATSQSPKLVERLVSSILHLGGAAFYRSDLSTAKVHANAAVRIAEQQIGGVTNLQDPFIQGRILSLDDLLSCVELVPCVASRAYDPGPAAILEIEEADMLPVDIPPVEIPLVEIPPVDIPPVNDETLAATLLLQDSILVQAEVRVLVLQIAECYKIQLRLLHSRRQISTANALKIKHWLTMRTLAIRNRLLAFTDPDSRIEALRVALILWTLLPPRGNVKKYAKVVQNIAPNVRTLLEQTSDWSGHEAIKFWCLLIGYCCASEEVDDAQNWFAEEIRKMRRQYGQELGVNVSSDLSEKLIDFQKRFFFYEGLLRPVTEKLAEWLLWCDTFPGG